MEYFDRDVKYNWVDENNVFLGFSNDQGCCEDFGFFYHTDPEGKDIIIPSAEELKEYRFNTEFHTYGVFPGNDEGGSFTVMLQKESNKDIRIYLTIYNHHNGHYAHGFVFSNSMNIIEEYSL